MKQEQYSRWLEVIEVTEATEKYKEVRVRAEDIYHRDIEKGDERDKKKKEKQAYLNSANAFKFSGERGAAAAQVGREKCFSLLPSLRVCTEPLVPTGRLSTPTNTGDFSLSEAVSALPPTA